MLRRHKYPQAGPIRSYQLARKQAIDLFVDGKALDPSAALRSHERDAVTAMVRMNLRKPEWVRGVRPSTREPPFKLGNVLVSASPDVELDGYIAAGAAKFSFTKQALARGVGSTMAALLWYWRRRVVGIEKVQPGNCIVYEPRLPWTHLPGRNPLAQVERAALACQVIEALWPKL
jgi:hypothetical protein